MKKLNKYFIVCMLACIPFISFAHVAYVIPHDELEKGLGADTHFLGQALFDPFNILLMLSTIVLVLVVGVVCAKNKKLQIFFKHVSEKLSSYHEFIPWIIRLSLGIALIGAGTEQVLISPVIGDAVYFSTLQIALGFAFLMGFLLVPAAVLTIGLYGIGLYTNTYLIGNIDVLALAVGFLVFHSARPGVDDILNISLLKFLKINRKYLAPLLRLFTGVGFMFLGLYEKLLNPHISEFVVAKFHLASIIPVSPEMWVLSVGLIEVALGLVILIGFYTRTAAVVGIVVLSTTFFFFKESVYSHVTLFGILSIIAIEGGGYISVDSKLLKK